MMFLKLNTVTGRQVIVNMSLVKEIVQAGVKTRLVYENNDYEYYSESFAEVEAMLQYSLIGNHGVMSLEDCKAIRKGGY